LIGFGKNTTDFFDVPEEEEEKDEIDVKEGEVVDKKEKVDFVKSLRDYIFLNLQTA
jgi:hypothetical protein